MKIVRVILWTREQKPHHSEAPRIIEELIEVPMDGRDSVLVKNKNGSYSKSDLYNKKILEMAERVLSNPELEFSSHEVEY